MNGKSSSSPRIGDSVEVEIEKLIFRGAGLARWRGMVVLVPASAPKDYIRALVNQKRSHYLEAEIEEILSPSPERVSPFCRHVPSCGGCQWQHLSLPAQRQWKERILRELLSPLVSRVEAAIGEILPVSPPQGYRTRAQVKVEGEGDRSRLGFYRSRSQALAEIEFCPLLHPDLQKIYRSLRDLKYPTLSQLYPSLREIWMQRGSPGGEILLTLITPPSSRAALRLLYHRLKEVFPDLAGIALAWGRDRGAYDQAGDAHVEMALRGLKLRVGPTCFYQVGEAGAETIFQIIESGIGPAQMDRVLDLYCGVGAFCLPLAKGGKEVVGVEAHGEATCLAQENAQRNELSRVHLIHGTAEQALSGPLADEAYDLVILDPPRSGLSRRAMEGLLRLGSPRIVYISCDPSTFARDLALLMAKGYECRRIQPLDLFPHTFHIETVAWLERSEGRP